MFGMRGSRSRLLSEIRLAVQQLILNFKFLVFLMSMYDLSPCVFQVIPLASEEQLLLVELVRSVSAMRTETVIQTVKEVLKQPPAIAKDKVGVSILDFHLLDLNCSSILNILNVLQIKNNFRFAFFFKLDRNTCRWRSACCSSSTLMSRGAATSS